MIWLLFTADMRNFSLGRVSDWVTMISTWNNHCLTSLSYDMECVIVEHTSILRMTVSTDWETNENKPWQIVLDSDSLCLVEPFDFGMIKFWLFLNAKWFKTLFTKILSTHPFFNQFNTITGAAAHFKFLDIFLKFRFSDGLIASLHQNYIL